MSVGRRKVKSHVKVAEIERMARCNEIHKKFQEMYKAEHDTSCNVFQTANTIGKHGQLLTDMSIDVSLQEF